MKKNIEKILEIWHKHFENEEHQYSEFEPSDIEYFVGCMLYNHFAFSKALDTMKTIDLSYDFISEWGNEYDEVLSIIKSINYKDELEALEVLQNFISESKKKYTADESYLLNRLQYHVNAMADRYNQDVEVVSVEFKNPLDR
jgi:hypothetical protein